MKTKERKAAVKQAPVMSDEEIWKVIAVEETTPTILRDKLVVLIGTSVVGWAVEIVSLRVEDISLERDGFFIHF